MGDTTRAAPGTLAVNQAGYRLRVEGRLDELAFEYVDNLTLALAIAPPGRTVTTLTCELPDQESLVGLINLLHDFGLSLTLVERLDRLAYPEDGDGWHPE